MALAELIPSVHALSRADKLRLMQVFVTDLAREEGVSPFEEGIEYPIWTPLDAYDAAAVLLRELQAEEAAR